MVFLDGSESRYSGRVFLNRGSLILHNGRVFLYSGTWKVKYSRWIKGESVYLTSVSIMIRRIFRKSLEDSLTSLASLARCFVNVSSFGILFHSFRVEPISNWRWASLRRIADQPHESTEINNQPQP